MDEWDFEHKLWLGVGIAALGIVGVPSAFAINRSVVGKTQQTANEEIVCAREEINKHIAEKINLADFSIASVELADSGQDSIMKVFGSTSLEEIVGLKEQRYLNVLFNISNESAENILTAAKTAASTTKVSRNTPELESNYVNYGDNSFDELYKFSESGKIRENKSAVLELYEEIDAAIANAYLNKIEEISEASQFNNQVSNEYRFTKPETVSNTTDGGLFNYVDTTFVNTGIMVTNVSQVAKDANKNVSFFLVDTLQGRNDGDKVVIESCRAKIEVQGTNLSQEEVYAQFLAGNASMTEIVREKAGSKAGIMENEVKTDINEIEMF